MDEHGGKRKGAGRHPLSETEDVVTISFKVPVSVKLVAEKLGEGNVSKGIRLLIEAGIDAFDLDESEDDPDHFWIAFRRNN